MEETNKSNAETIKSKLKKCLIARDRTTTLLEESPEIFSGKISNLEKANKKIYRELINPIYNALSHGDKIVNKEDFYKLLGYIGLYETFIAQQRGEFYSDKKTILGNPIGETKIK